MSFIEMKNICKKYAGADKNSVTDFSLSVEEVNSLPLLARPAAESRPHFV